MRKMSSKAFLFLCVSLAFAVIMIASEVAAARELTETSVESYSNDEVQNAKGVEESKYPRGGYPGGGYGGYPGGGYGGYPGGGNGGYPGGGNGGYPGGGNGGYPGGGNGGYPGGGNGGYPGGGNGGRGGHGGGGGHCRWGCCGRNYYGGGCRCCSYAGEAVDAEPQTKP